MLAPMGASSYSDIKDSLRHLYFGNLRPWLVGFSGRKDSTMLATTSTPATPASDSLGKCPSINE